MLLLAWTINNPVSRTAGEVGHDNATVACAVFLHDRPEHAASFFLLRQTCLMSKGHVPNPAPK